MERENAEALERIMRLCADQGGKLPLNREGIILITTYPDVFEDLFAKWPELQPWS